MRRVPDRFAELHDVAHQNGGKTTKDTKGTKDMVKTTFLPRRARLIADALYPGLAESRFGAVLRGLRALLRKYPQMPQMNTDAGVSGVSVAIWDICG